MKIRRIEDRKLSDSFIKAVEEEKIEIEKDIKTKMAEAIKERGSDGINNNTTRSVK